MRVIECYRNDKIVLRVECSIREDVFLEQLKKGIIYYNTGYSSGDTEIIYLNSFDRVIVKDCLLYDELTYGSDKE